eukprot:9418369-Alexandrium_andersonii.AAC.1
MVETRSIVAPLWGSLGPERHLARSVGMGGRSALFFGAWVTIRSLGAPVPLPARTPYLRRRPCGRSRGPSSDARHAVLPPGGQQG